MAIYSVVRKADSVEMWRYQAPAPTENLSAEYPTWPFAIYSHVEYFETPPPPTTVYGGRRTLTHLEFMSLFTADERVAIRAAGASNPYVYDFLELMQLSQEIDVDDPRTQVGVMTLEQMAVIAAGRAEKVLNA
jgi:hypothetical protein